MTRPAWMDKPHIASQIADQLARDEANRLRATDAPVPVKRKVSRSTAGRKAKPGTDRGQSRHGAGKHRGPSKLEAKFWDAVVASGMRLPVREHCFVRAIVGDGPGVRSRIKAAGLRDWRFDFAWPAERVSVEIEGGVWTGGGHTRGLYYSDNCRKYNTAVRAGWAVLRYAEPNLRDMDEVIRQVGGLLKARG